MADKAQNQDQLEQIGDSLTKVERFVEDNKKTVLYVVAVIVLLICGFFAYKKLYLEKQQNKALSEMWAAEAQFRADSFNIALYGNDNVTGFEDIINEYGRTKAGNTCKYYAGVCALRLGKYEEAVDYLESFSTDDPILEPLSIGLLADAYSELGEYGKAVKKYEKAASVADNELISPRFLLKAGLHYEKLGDYASALKAYTKIQKDFNGAPEANSIEKYITRVQLKQ